MSHANRVARAGLAFACLAVMGCSSEPPSAGSTGTSSASPSASTGTTPTPKTITLYEVARVVALTDNTPIAFSPPPPKLLAQTPGPGDVLVLESDLFGTATTRTANTGTEPPQAIPGVSLPEGDYETFDPNGEKIGELQGTCTFIRVIDNRPTFEDRTMTCTVTLTMKDGSLTYAGLLDVDQLEGAKPVTVPVVGGTGSFTGANGTITLQQPSPQAFDRFRLDIDL